MVPMVAASDGGTAPSGRSPSPPRRAARNDLNPYQIRNAAPPQRIADRNHGARSAMAPAPATPAAIRMASDSAQNAQTAKT